ncbi:MAG TPA: hypothetical protein VFW09_10210 [Solirubrobacteraceae bacterium]|nr:hypothetical protein [Solirubrobacteraceae bacterium]
MPGLPQPGHRRASARGVPHAAVTAHPPIVAVGAVAGGARRAVAGSARRALAVALGAMLLLGATLLFGIGAASARAAGLPNPGGANPLAFPRLTRQTLASPPVAARVKFRWWQPVADTHDAQIRAEVKTMAGNFGGGFEQNGFPVNMNAGGDTPQFLSFANSRQFTGTYGLGSALWRHRTEVYQRAAAANGVIGDMNEGSRWDNTAPEVYSPNQAADARDLSYGVRQYQPGEDPSGELPAVNAPALGGESTTLTTQANPGDRTLQVQSIAGLLTGDQITLGQGTAAETATIKHVGTPTAEMPLSQNASAGSQVVHVTPPDTTTGVPGTAEQAAQLVPGEHVRIGSGADADHDVIAKIGTFDMVNPLIVPYEGAPIADWIWNTPNSAGSAAAGTIYLRKTFTTPAGMTRARLRINADDAEVTYVNGQQAASSTYPNWPTSENADITKDLNPAGQRNVIAVAATNNSPGAAGVIAAVAIDGSSPQRIVTDSSWKAWPAPTANPPTSPTPPASDWNTVGFDDSAWSNAASAGPYGISPWGTRVDGNNTAPSSLVAQPGGSATVAAPAGATNVELASTSGFLRGDTITIGSGASAESRAITSVGVSGSGTTLSSSANAGDLQLTVASTAGLTAGQYITVGQGSGQETDRIATINGSTLTLYSALHSAHSSGDPVAVKSIGVTFTPALGHSHDVGEAAIDTGTGITLAHPLAHDHTTGEEIASPGTGVTLTAPLQHAHATGANDAITTSLSTATDASATNIKLGSVAGFAAGDRITVGQPGYAETVTVKTVGTAGADGTGVTVSPALSRPHDAGDPVIDASDASVTNASAGVSDIERESLIAAELVQCLAPSVADSETTATTSLSAAASSGATSVTVKSIGNVAVGDRVTIGSGGGAETRTVTAVSGDTLTLGSALSGSHAAGDPVWDTCTTAATGGTRELDPSTARVVTGDVVPNRLTFTTGTLNYGGAPLPAGNGQPWELIDFYIHGDTQTNTGGTTTTPNQWLGHLSTASAKAMERFFDDDVLDDPATRAAIAYQDRHTDTPAVFEDSLENANNLNWVRPMVASWKRDLGYDPTALLPALAATGRNATGTPAFDFPQSNGQGATLGWRVRDDYGQMWSNRYIHDYVGPLDRWARAHGLVARFQSYGDPIDEGEASANEGIAETEHLETAGHDETQQFKVAASGTYQDRTPHFLSNECCEAPGMAWADPFGIDGTGNGASPDATEPNAESVYADEAGGDSQVIYHGWPYTIGAAGSSALWPGNTYGGDTSYAAGNGPNQPQFTDDRSNNVNVARRALVLRQGEPSFDVAVFHEDFGLTGQGQDRNGSGWNLGSAISNGTTRTPTSGKLLASSSSLAQAGYLYGYVSPAFFHYSSARFAVDPRNRDQDDPANGNRVLFPEHGDYKALVLYDQSVMPVAVANKVAALAGQGLPIVIVGQVPNAAPSATGGSLAGMSAADAQVQAAMAKVTASPHTKVVADATASGSPSSDANAPGALASLGVTASTQLNTASSTSGAVATPVLGIRRHVGGRASRVGDADYYQLFNPNTSTTVYPSVTLTGHGRPYVLDPWTGTFTPIANYVADGNRITVSLRLAPANAQDIVISTSNLGGGSHSALHATSTTANATPYGIGNVVFDAAGRLVARASQSGSYSTKLSDGTTVNSTIAVPQVSSGADVSMIAGTATLTKWQLSVDSWTQTASGDPTQTAHTRIPASGSITVTPLSGVSDGSLPSWTQITPQNIPGLDPADNLTNVAGIGSYTTSFALPSNWSRTSAGAYLNIGAAVDTVDIWANGRKVAGVDENDRNQIDIGPYLRPGDNQLRISVATPLRNAVAVAPATPATGQVPNSAEVIGSVQGGAKLSKVGLLGPVTITPYGQRPLATPPSGHVSSASRG